MPSPSSSTAPDFFTAQTLLSLLSTVLILATAYALSLRLLSASTSTKIRTLYIWHLADGITHLTLEASFLYNCFFSYTTLPFASDWPHPASQGGAGAVRAPVLWGRRDRAYGPAHGTNPPALLWQEYAKADARWGGADLTVISLELLTVFLAGPMALWVSELIRRGVGAGDDGKGRATAVATEKGRLGGQMWFWASVLATGELYGGFMTFAPEWLSGNENLDGSNFMYMWLYLFFFNMLWVWFPFWILYEAYQEMVRAFGLAATAASAKEE